MGEITVTTKAFLKVLGKLERRGVSRREAFRDFLEMGYCALAQRTPFVTPDRAAELEARYMRAIKPYAEWKERYVFPELMSLAMRECAEPGGDYLGEIAGEGELLSPELGQFFTPYHVSLMMAKATLADCASLVEEHGYFTMAELACGAGSMVLAAAQVVEEAGLELATSMLVMATDLSDQAFKMAYIQLSARGVAAEVVRGDTLSGEVMESAWTLGAATFHGRHGHLWEPETPPPRIRTRAPA